MKCTCIFLSLLCLVLMKSSAQSYALEGHMVISNAGDSDTEDGYLLSWTLGELVIEHVQEDNLYLGQGFQPVNFIGGTPAFEVPGLTYNIEVYPNPVAEVLHLKTNSPETLTCELLDLQGRILLSEHLTSPSANWILNDLPDAFYVLRVLSQEGQLLQTHKIIKSNF